MPNFLRHLSKLDIPGGGQVVAENAGLMSAISRRPTAPRSSTSPTRGARAFVSQVSLPSHTHSHKVRAHGDIMLVNNELFRSTTGERPEASRAGSRSTTRRTRPTRVRSALQVAGVAPFRFGRRLRLHLVRGKRLCRRHRRDPRPRRPDQARADRQMVDAGAMGRRRRGADLAGKAAPLPSPAAPRQPALYELLARRLRHPRHRRHPQPDLYQRPRLEPALPVPNAYRAADPHELMGRKIAVVTDEKSQTR